MALANPDSELAKAFRNQVILESREAGRRLIELAMQAGERRAQADVEKLLDMVDGPLFFRLLAGHLPLSVAFAAKLVDTLFDSVAGPVQRRR